MICVNQVTTRSHTGANRRLKYARTFDLGFHVIYVRPAWQGLHRQTGRKAAAQVISIIDPQNINIAGNNIIQHLLMNTSATTVLLSLNHS
jgi:hypothetical protein